jgi:hypothetical protein
MSCPASSPQLARGRWRVLFDVVRHEIIIAIPKVENCFGGRSQNPQSSDAAFPAAGTLHLCLLLAAFLLELTRPRPYSVACGASGHPPLVLGKFGKGY